MVIHLIQKIPLINHRPSVFAMVRLQNSDTRWCKMLHFKSRCVVSVFLPVNWLFVVCRSLLSRCVNELLNILYDVFHDQIVIYFEICPLRPRIRWTISSMELHHCGREHLPNYFLFLFSFLVTPSNFSFSFVWCATRFLGQFTPLNLAEVANGLH